MRKLALHWQILLGMLFGILFGLLCSQFDWGKQFVIDWIKPFGTIFINSLKLIARKRIWSTTTTSFSQNRQRKWIFRNATLLKQKIEKFHLFIPQIWLY